MLLLNVQVTDLCQYNKDNHMFEDCNVPDIHWKKNTHN